MAKLTFAEVLDRLAEDRPIARGDIAARVLRRRVWVMHYSAPGCLADHSNICRTKRDAINSARTLYADDAPRGFITELERNGIAAADEQGDYCVEIAQVAIADLL